MGICQGNKPRPFSNIRARLASSEENIKTVYSFGKVLGQGNFSTVRLATLVSNEKMEFAVKIIDKSKVKRIDSIIQELSILQTIDHPNIVKFNEIYEDDKFVYVIMEPLFGGDLLHRLIGSKKFLERDAFVIIEKLLSAVAYLHELKIVHRDLKMDNLLYKDQSDEPELKLIDFGLSKFNVDGFVTMKTKVGTPIYVAPEVIRGKYNFKCDIWSVGVIMYILLSGNPPFYDNDEAGLFSKILNSKVEYEGPVWQNISEDAIDMLKKMLNHDFSTRITARECLKHPWITRHQENLLTSEQNLLDRNIIYSLKTLKTMSTLKKEVMRALINTISEKDIKSLNDAFKRFDKFQTGVITLEELKLVMLENGFNETEREILNIMNTINFDKNSDKQKINYSDFLASTIDHKNYLTKQTLWNLFKRFDVTNSNTITTDDLVILSKREGKHKSIEEIKRIISENDIKKDGVISFEEFCIMMDFQEQPEEGKAE